MFIFGHMGIGSKLASPWTRGLPRRAVLLGTLLPDLIDKPVYYGLSAITGKRGAELGLICGTRTFGHTALFLIALSLVAVWRRSKTLAAVAIGVATHLLLDNVGDRFGTGLNHYGMSALLWPLQPFPVMPFNSLGEHMASFNRPFMEGAEILGLLIIGWDAWKRAHQKEIVASVQERRVRFRLLRRRRRHR